MANFPTKLGGTHNADAWKKMKISKDFNLGVALNALDPAMADFSAKQASNASLRDSYQRLTQYLRAALKSADMVSKLPTLPDEAAAFCEKLDAVLTSLLKHANNLYSQKESDRTAITVRIKAYVKKIDTHIALLEETARQFAAGLKKMQADLKHAVSTVQLMKSTPSEQELKNYMDTFLHDDLDPIEKNYSDCKTLYKTVEPCQTNYRQNPLGELDDLQDTDRANARAMLASQFSKSDKIWREAEQLYKQITSTYEGAQSARNAADAAYASRYGQMQKQETSNITLIEKTTQIVQKTCITISDLVVTKGHYEKDYVSLASRQIAPIVTQGDKEKIAEYITNNLLNFKNTLGSVEKTALTLLGEIKKRYAECIKLVPAQNSPLHTPQIGQALDALNKAVAEANQLAAYAAKQIPIGKKSVNDAIALAKKALAKLK